MDPRLEYASTIPSSFYDGRDVLDREQRAVFAKTWQLAGRAEQVREPAGSSRRRSRTSRC